MSKKMNHSASYSSAAWESASVVSPIYRQLFTSETPDMLDDQYEGRIQGYTYAREGIQMQQPLRNR